MTYDITGMAWTFLADTVSKPKLIPRRRFVERIVYRMRLNDNDTQISGEDPILIVAKISFV
jgi:hypothetical protein